MGDVTKHLSRCEFACRCGCGFIDPHPCLVVGLEEIRSAAGVPIWISSGCRCPEHNREEGGAPFSFHLPQQNGYGFAADWFLEGLNLREMVWFAEKSRFFAGGGIGAYYDAGKIWVHTDVRLAGPVRWGSLDGVEITLGGILEAVGRTVRND